jgi:hypothetical protein
MNDVFDEMPWLRPNGSKPEERTYCAVARAILRGQTRALILEHAARVAGEDFRGSEVAPPRMLLTVPGGGPFPAELNDVCELEIDLMQMAAVERQKIARLMDCPVTVDPSDVDHPIPLRGAGTRLPQDGRVERNDVEPKKKENR